MRLGPNTSVAVTRVLMALKVVTFCNNEETVQAEIQ